MNNNQFLEHVACDLLAKHGNDLSRLVVVFPNKRASLFLNTHLAQHSGGRPLWSPRYMTISELFRQMGSRNVADPIKLVCELHRSFTMQTGIDETLDHFYGWGQLLLSDFDDLDKCMADVDHVLANLRDIHELDAVDYLTDEQKEAISHFFSNFSPDHNTLLRERFLKLWSHMADIYHDFNKRLADQQTAYEGALYREVVESLSAGEEAPSQGLWQTFCRSVGGSPAIVFVGFNVLQEVERQLFRWLKRQGRARFYWDFDKYYMESEAGMFVARNMEEFPGETATDDDLYDCFAQPKSITVVSAHTDNIQARYVPQWLGSTASRLSPHHEQNLHEEAVSAPWHNIREEAVSAPWLPDTAIVLCDESLLPTVIHCLPDSVDHVNVTTGYPLSHTPAASLITTLFALRTQGYQPGRGCYRLRQVNALLRHPYISPLTPAVDQLSAMLSEQKVYHPTPQQLATDDVTSLLFRDLAAKGDSQSVQGDLQSVQGDLQSPFNAALLEWMCDVVRLAASHPGESVQGDLQSVQGDLQSPPEDGAPFNIETESLFRAYTLLNRLQGLVASGDLQVDIITLQRLMTQLMQTTTIPFHGEPAKGLQVMGLLETRCLDFSHVLLLSANDGNLPKGVSDTSFIPYTLRKAYGLTTADHKVAIYSYYFHRLLQRADDVTIVYNNSTTDGHTGEMSRFALQLLVEDRHHIIATKALQAAQTFIPFRPKTVEKDEVIIQKLLARFSATPGNIREEAVSAPWQNDQEPILTPSAINRYQRCPLLFYYTYVHDLRESDDSDDDTIDNRIFGNIFHEAARILYSRLMEKSRRITASDLEQLLKSRGEIEMAVDQALRQELFHCSPEFAIPVPPLSGLQLINREVITHYLRQLLTIDRRLAPFAIEGLESDVAMPLSTPHITTVIGGRIDRLDRIACDGGEQIRVIDYKTGSHVAALPSVEAIFDQNQLKNHSDYYLQTFLYSVIVSRHPAISHPSPPPSGHHPNAIAPTPVAPALLFIQHAAADDYSPVLKFGKDTIDDVAPHADLFMDLLTEVIDEIFTPEVPFTPTADRSRCANCPYRLLCV